MPKPILNGQQKVAVNPNLRLPAIVTASAGSGKTFVLVERVIRLICDRSLNIPVDSLAIMTFTRNATRSMRQKLSKALDEKLDEIANAIEKLKNETDATENLSDELLSLEQDYDYINEQKFKLRQTTISTIDAFCLNMIKENIELFDLPVNFTLVDSTKAAALQTRAITLTMQDFYDESQSLFTEEERNTLFYTFSFNNDDDLQKTTIYFANELSTYVNADKWLDKALAVYNDEKSLEAQYSGVFLSFFDAYFSKTSASDPTKRRGLVEKRFDEYDKIVNKILRDGNSMIQAYSQELSDKIANGAKAKETTPIKNKITSAVKLVDDIIPEIKDIIKTEKANFQPLYDAYEVFKTEKTISSLADFFEAVKNIPSPPDLPKGGTKTDSRKLLTANRKACQSIIKTLDSYSFSSDNNTTEQQTAVRAFIKLVRTYSKYYSELKKSSGCVDFSDCELLLLNKLTDTNNEEFCQSLRERFQFLIVDEFQDSNDIQAEIFKTIAGDKLFYVGDTKQSIYAFRGGNPKIMARLVDGEDGFTPVPLSTNFRSRNTVLDVVNHAFSGLMTKEYGDVEYSKPENILKYGASFPNTPDSEKYCAEIHLITGDVDEENKQMRQPRLVAQRIKELHDDPNFFITKDEQLVRPDYSDFLILTRTKTKVPDYRKALSELGISSVSSKGQSFLASEEIELMLNILAIVDNPLKDEQMLKVLMSPIYRFTAEEVTDIRLGLLGLDKTLLTVDQKKTLAAKLRKNSLYKCLRVCCENLKLSDYFTTNKDDTTELSRAVPQKLAQFMTDLKNFRYYMSSNSLHKLVCKIYEDTDAELIAAVFEDSAQRVANIRQLQDIAADFQQRDGGSLGDFLRFIERVKSNQSQKVEDANRPENNIDAVQIMTFHVSKGLEAPICILSELNEKMSDNDYTGTFLNNRENYFAMMNVDYKKRVKSKSFAYSALKLINRKRMCSEELRLLYVALTRAQEKLIMVTAKSIDDLYSSVLDTQNPEDVFNGSVPFDWILSSLMRYPVTDLKFNDFNCKIFEDIYDGAAPMKTSDGKPDFDIPKEKVEALLAKMNFEYANSQDTKRQEKYSVTELAHRNSDMPITLSTPSFIERELTGADKGNAYHNCMQYISFDRFKDLTNDDPVDIAKSEIQRLASLKKLNEREVKCIEPQKIADFFTGALGQRILSVSRIEREKAFFAEVNGTDICENDLGTIMLQGRVDMYFIENGEIVVVDYKTDSKQNLEKEKENYAKQVKIYSTVLNKLTGMNVKEVYLYSFTDSEAISIT